MVMIVLDLPLQNKCLESNKELKRSGIRIGNSLVLACLIISK